MSEMMMKRMSTHMPGTTQFALSVPDIASHHTRRQYPTWCSNRIGHTTQPQNAPRNRLDVPISLSVCTRVEGNAFDSASPGADISRKGGTSNPTW
eukprot:1341616-Rhodomonas_salina.2